MMVSIWAAVWRCLPVLVVACCLPITHAQQASTPNPSRNLSIAASERRVALVIGNAAYQQGALVNPVNDARAMSSRLRSLGFDVMLKENLKQREIGGVYREFRSKIGPGAVALVFYAGHGVQVRGQNYFPAVDSDISSEEDVPLHSLNLSTLLDNMEEAKAGVSLVFLDACRDNPFARRFRSASRGLAKIEAASGTLIHYATKPGSVAADGDGQNGTYTEALLAQIGEPGVPVELMLKKVANQVVTKTKGKQEPWAEGSLRGDFYFIFNGPTTVQVQQGSADPETAFWNEVKAGGTRDYLEAYLKQYPTGKFQALAKLELKKLDDGEKAQAAREEAERKLAEEQAAWKQAETSGDQAAVQSFLTRYPAGPFAKMAAQKLALMSTAKIYIINPPRHAGSFGRPDMSLGDKFLGGLPNETYLVTNVAPGQYTLIGKGLWYKMMKNLDLRSGGVFYLDVNTGDLTISLLNEAEGKAALAHTVPAKTEESDPADLPVRLPAEIPSTQVP